ncbi:transposase [Colwellia sp. E2M01]|uniref:transposase n=1 Tax=Colwellia sp. E2M01 TaxID=2841561 RepID=UPI001C091308|nr:transposase [Colwellia sp. E2M01]MBU2870202.1 transposase [Colwellia sp. E2M01]
MTNHVHLLCTAKTTNGISNMMQALGGYVRYFNNIYHRSGTLWERRFKSCIVEEEEYLLQVYRYIELNPV